MTTTDQDRTGADVSWDLDPLVDGRGDAGVTELLDDAERRAEQLTEYRGRIGSLDASELARLMELLAGITELVGRAGSYAALRFSVDTTDPTRGALLAQVEERSTAISNDLLFIELEWAALPDERVAAVIDDPALSFCRHHLRSVRRLSLIHI